MAVLWWVGAWLVLSPLVLLLVAALCRAGHQEDVARHYVEDLRRPVRRRSRSGGLRPTPAEHTTRTRDSIG